MSAKTHPARKIVDDCLKQHRDLDEKIDRLRQLVDEDCVPQGRGSRPSLPSAPDLSRPVPAE